MDGRYAGSHMADEAEKTEIEGAPGKKRMSRTTLRVLLIVVAVVVIALILWIIHYETRGKYVEGTNDAYIRADSVTASPKISGYVEQVYVADNQDVKAGQPLVRIDPRLQGGNRSVSRADRRRRSQCRECPRRHP
jgi:membrane fusion protein (multidrug efflux system)